MISYTINYEDFNGDSRVEKLRFNLSEPELMKLTETDPSLNANTLLRIAEEKDPRTMFNIIQKILVYSYGILSEDGRIFRKNEQIRDDFINSAAYAALIDELTTDPDETKLTNLLSGIFPKKLMNRVAAAGNGQPNAPVVDFAK